jgi:hypothetical protein
VLPLASAAGAALPSAARVKGTTTPRRPAAAKPSAHVASGLKLNTKEP